MSPESGEQFIKVTLTGRYYGVGYERGDLPTLLLIAEWLEENFKPCEVWYGGDSSGVQAALFDSHARQRLKEHFFTVGHRPYQNAFSRHPTDAPVCPVCIEPMVENGGGGAKTFYFCYGCGNKAVASRDRILWHEGESFEASARFEAEALVR